VSEAKLWFSFMGLKFYLFQMLERRRTILKNKVIKRIFNLREDATQAATHYIMKRFINYKLIQLFSQ